MVDHDQREAKDAEVVHHDVDIPHASAPDGRHLARPQDDVPAVLVALPLNQRPVFPTMMLPLSIPAGRLAEAARFALRHMRGHVGFFMTRAALPDGAAFSFADLHRIGCAARILKSQDADDGGVQVIAQVIARFQIEGVEAAEPVLTVRGHVLQPQVDPADPEVRGRAMAIVAALKELVSHNPVFADEIKVVLANFNSIDGPGRLADLAVTLTTANRDEVQAVLETVDVPERMDRALALLAKETQLAQIKSRVAQQIEQKVGENQRKFFLNEQLKAIKAELGLETDDKSLDIKRFREVLQAKGEAMGAEVRQVIEEELRKLSLLEPASSEYGVVRSRLEWLSELPWGTMTEDDLEIARLREGLDADHHGLDEVKERIVEFCAVRKLRHDRGGGIIALVGPPGTGKTSIGQSIARHLGRKFYRLSLGGMRDEAEIRGHRRTYVGALPGKMVQALRRCGSMNPVILLDEIDKLSVGLQGDPAAALLEVLDPEQNRDFLDHYLDVRVDLSKVLFVCTANELSGIPEPLRDRMEVIRLAGYVESEKVAIASKHLVAKQRQAHGLDGKDLTFSRAALQSMVRDYAREAGVRHLEQLVARVCRKVATEKASAGDAPFERRAIAPSSLVRYLGKPLMRDDELIDRAVPGVVTGLAWTAMGGATLEIEAVAAPTEKGGLVLTGQLGDVMKESAQLARSYLISRSAAYGIEAGWFDRHLIHVHVPAGATPKDGPSAGITIATALLSLALGRPVRRKIGMTGELTLTGRVYPIGGVREKLVSAQRSRLRSVLLPAGNERDVAELPEHLRTGVEIQYVRELDEVVRAAGLVSG